MKKIDKIMFKELEKRMGNGAGLLVAVLLDALDSFTDGVESRNIRTIEIKFNDFYSHRVDLDEEQKKKEAKMLAQKEA